METGTLAGRRGRGIGREKSCLHKKDNPPTGAPCVYSFQTPLQPELPQWGCGKGSALQVSHEDLLCCDASHGPCGPLPSSCLKPAAHFRHGPLLKRVAARKPWLDKGLRFFFSAVSAIPGLPPEVRGPHKTGLRGWEWSPGASDLPSRFSLS